MLEGKVYDQTGEGVKAHIQSFIDTYDLPMNELLVQDLDQYPVRSTQHPEDNRCTWLITQTFNSFFSRRLQPSARPITSPHDPSIIVSPADCRLTVYASVDQAKKFWSVSPFSASRFGHDRHSIAADM
jgi:phosphatidylserine decarboxylase